MAAEPTRLRWPLAAGHAREDVACDGLGWRMGAVIVNEALLLSHGYASSWSWLGVDKERRIAGAALAGAGRGIK